VKRQPIRKDNLIAYINCISKYYCPLSPNANKKAWAFLDYTCLPVTYCKDNNYLKLCGEKLSSIVLVLGGHEKVVL
jgi:hypothetical protein